MATIVLALAAVATTLPAARACRVYGCDAAHSFAHLDFEIPDLHCDYLGTSLHKWLGAPLGTGLMYVRKDKISKVWPLFADRIYPKDDIRKFEHIGVDLCAEHYTHLMLHIGNDFNVTEVF